MELLKQIVQRFCDEYGVVVHRYNFVYQSGSFLIMEKDGKASIKDISIKEEIEIANDLTGSKMLSLLDSMYDDLA